MILHLLSQRFVRGVQAVFEINSCFFKQAKSFKNYFMKLRIKNLQYLIYRNVADDVLFQKHFTDLDYIH